MLLSNPRFIFSIFVVLVLVLMPWWTVDDAFISYRYGRNLLESGVLTWNVGEEPPVEGYTGILLPLLSAAILGLGLPLVFVIKVLSLVAMGGTVFMVANMLKRAAVRPFLRTMTVVFLIATPLLYMHALSGLETAFFTFLIMGVFWTLSRLKADKGNSFILLGFLLAAGLCRPEGIALAGIVILFLAIRRMEWPRPALMAAIIAFAMLIAYWIWRAVYYQSFFPNSYHAKTFDGWINWESVLAMGKFAGYYCFLPVLVVLILGLAAGKAQKLSQAANIEKAVFSSIQPIFFVFLGICLLTYLHSNLWMNYGSRFFFPFLPLIMVLITQWMDKNLTRRKENQVRLKPSIIYLFSALAILQFAVLAFRFRQEMVFLNYYHAIVQEELIPAGQSLKRFLPPDATVISYVDAGAVGYYSELKVIDFGRLSDRYLAQTKPAENEVKDYFFSQNADAVVITSQSSDTYSYIPEAEAIVKDPRFQDFHFINQWGNSAGFPYWQRLYLRRE